MTVRVQHKDRTGHIHYLTGPRRKHMPTAQTNELIRRWQQEGDVEARNAVVESNLRFIASVVRKDAPATMSFDDAMNSGVLGMIEAMDRFDTERGFKFISYAVHWVRQSIRAHGPENGHIVHLPQQVGHIYTRVARRKARLEQELGRSVSDVEAAAVMDDLSPIWKERLGKFSSMHSSIDAPVEDDVKAREISFFLAAPEPEEEPEGVDLALSAMDQLPEREARIVRMYFGLDGGEPMTLEEIGGTMSLTRERVRQLRDRALAQLRQRGRQCPEI